MDLYTSSWSNKEIARLECIPVGISRGTPKYRTPYRYRQARELLAPSRETFGKQTEEEYEESYLLDLEAVGLETILDGLERISAEENGLPLVLLCFEKEPSECHRSQAARWLYEQAGIEVPELQRGDVPDLGHTRPAQERLF